MGTGALEGRLRIPALGFVVPPGPYTQAQNSVKPGLSSQLLSPALHVCPGHPFTVALQTPSKLDYKSGVLRGPLTEGADPLPSTDSEDGRFMTII